MTTWYFENVSRRRPRVEILSADHAVQLYYLASGEDEYAVCIDIIGEPAGLIFSIAGQEFATLEYKKDYTSENHTTLGFQRALPPKPISSDPLIFVDSEDVLSTVSAEWLISIVDAASAIAHIIEHGKLPEELGQS